MKIIDAIKVTDASGAETLNPAEPFPSDSIAVICNGDKYIAYQQGDDIPPDPEAE